MLSNLYEYAAPLYFLLGEKNFFTVCLCHHLAVLNRHTILSSEAPNEVLSDEMLTIQP